MKELNERLSHLLERSIEDYIKNAVPISSGAIMQKINQRLSPATIRNDLKILEEMGYLKQVHTSSGRIPTTQGYRAYVNKVLGNLNIKPGELTIAADQISDRVNDLPNIIDEICKKLSATFDYPIIVKQQFEHLIVTNVTVVPLVMGSIMVLIKTNAGSITQNILTDGPLTETQCADSAAAINTKCIGLSLKEMLGSLPKITNEIGKHLKFFEGLCRSLSEKLERTIENNLSRRLNVIKLLDIPDYANIEKVKKVGKAIEDDQTMAEILGSDDSVVIGTEIAAESLHDSSVIKFDYKVGNESVASIGILGPERMDYKSLIAALYSLMSTTMENRKLEQANAPPLLD